MKKTPEQTMLDIVTARYIAATKALYSNVFATSTLWEHLSQKTGWEVPADPDPFETFVRETRAEAGIEDPPRQALCGGGQKGKSISEPIYWHGTFPYKILGPDGITEEEYEWDSKNYTTYGDLDKK